MFATLTTGPFDDDGWVFEDKYDGFRVVAKIGHRYIEVAHLEGEKADAMIDGEDKNGVSHFQLLQNALRHEAKLLYCAFDHMFCDGEALYYARSRCSNAEAS